MMANSILENKRILFLTWPAGEYPDKIKNELTSMGGKVDMYFSSPSKNFLYTRLLEKFPKLKKKYYSSIINSISRTDYDYVFMINAGVFPEYFIRQLSLVCAKATRILYAWDSVEVYPSAVKMHSYFNRLYSFDSEDVKKYPEMRFLPLFYCNESYVVPDNSIKYDFSFVGFAHTERYKFLKKIRLFARNNDFSCNFKLYLPSKIHYIRGKYIKKLFPEAKLNDFIFSPLSLSEVDQITRSSRIVVDLELKTQSGLTMRSIETHGARRKFITTNPHIKEYDFYNQNNILVVDRKNPVIPKEFVDTDYEILDENVYKKYSLRSWLITLFGA